jgi:molybdenum cofactor cytidylyltransferase
VAGEFSVVLLAAGRSSRMGVNKLLADLWGKPLISWSLMSAFASGSREVVVVVGHEAERVREHIPRGVSIVFNEEWAEGMASSIRRGVGMVSEGSRAAVILGGDQPLIPPALIAVLAGLVLEGGYMAAAISVRGEVRSPACFHRDVFPELLQLRGDAGAKPVVLRHIDRVALVEAEPHSLMDVDTPEDLERMRSMPPPTHISAWEGRGSDRGL